MKYATKRKGAANVRTLSSFGTSKNPYSLRRRIWKGRQNYLLMLPFLVFFFTFTLLPVILSLVLGFTNYDMLSMPTFAGFDNYMRMFFDDDVFLIAIKNTMIFALFTGPLSYLLCFLFAWLINEMRPKMRAFATVVFYAPALSGQVFTVWLFLFSSDQYGIINGTLMKLGLLSEPIAWLSNPAYSMKVLIIVQLWLSLGTGFLAFIAGLQGVDTSLYEAAAIDGIRNRFQELWHVTLPSMVPQLLFGAVMQIVASFSVAEVSMQLAGFPSVEYSAETVVTHIIDYGTLRFEMGYASAMAGFLFIMMLLAQKGVTKLLSGVGH